MPKTFASDAERRAYTREQVARHRARQDPELNRFRWRMDKRQFAARNPRTRAQDLPFVGCDGEGGDIDGHHKYLLLRIGDAAIEDPAGLATLDCLRFIADLDPAMCYVSYYFDYDVTMMLRSLPASRLARLLDRESRHVAKDGTRLNNPLPLDVGGEFQIDYLPRKFFKVRRRGAKRYVTISDVGPFFQCSFLKAIKAWQVGDEATWARIEAGKYSRSTFTELTDETRVYNRAEIDLLEQLMEAFRETCRDVGYMPQYWQGPGYLAVSMFKRNGIPKTKTYLPNLPEPLLLAAQAAFYGGRFETGSVGPVNGPIFQYDINSAYPQALTQLPCLEHGRWHQIDDKESEHVLRLVRFNARANGIGNVAYYGLPMRDKHGNICFPQSGQGWYWSHELDAAKHQRYVTLDAWSYERHCDCKPFDWVPGVYAERIALGKTARGIVLKLGLNSLYGKMVQSIGRPAYAQPVWGSLITSLVRAKLYSAIHAGTCTEYRCGERVHMLATDAVFSSEPLDLPCSKELGEWDREAHDGMFIIQPGVYFLDDNKSPKTRGIPQRDVIRHREDFLAAFATDWDSKVSIPMTVFVGMRQALHLRKPELMGEWLDVFREVGFSWESKRKGYGERDRGLRRDKWGNYRTGTIPCHDSIVSVPYDKDIGALFADRQIYQQDQPDFRSDTFIELED